MYLEHFGFDELPFVLTPNTNYFCNLPTYQEALNVLLLSIRSGEGFIKIIGEVGTGKTMLCRELLRKIDDEFSENYVTAYLSNPSLTSTALRYELAKELEIPCSNDMDKHQLLRLINNKLLELNRNNKRVIVIIDEAQMLSDRALEELRLLSNLETESTKLLQIILFGQTELDKRLKQKSLRQLKQRIAFSYYLRPVNRRELQVYVAHRLTKAGSKYAGIFNKKAYDLIYKASKGIPRLVNVLCHKALMAGYGNNKKIIGKYEARLAINDTDSVANIVKVGWLEVFILVSLVIFVTEILLFLDYYL